MFVQLARSSRFTLLEGAALIILDNMVSLENLAHAQGNMTALAFFDMNIVSATGSIIACLLVLMALVKEILYANTSKTLAKGPNPWCRVNNCTVDNEAAAPQSECEKGRFER